MPPIRRSNLGRRTRHAASSTNHRLNRGDAGHAERNNVERPRIAQLCSSQAQEERESQNAAETLRMRRNRSASNRTSDNHDRQNMTERLRRQARVGITLHRAAFNNDTAVDYSADATIGSMSIVCLHSKALKFRNEPPGLC